MSSIRRSSLLSITLGLPEVIGLTFRSFPLRRRRNNASEYPLDLISRLKDFGMTTQPAHSLIFWTHLFKVAHRTDKNSQWFQSAHVLRQSAIAEQSRFMSIRPSVSPRLARRNVPRSDPNESRVCCNRVRRADPRRMDQGVGALPASAATENPRGHGVFPHLPRE
jgi:hypothetical protein